MELYRLEQFIGGWFLGNFSPTLETSSQMEVGLKRYPKGAVEPIHHQLVSTEYTLIVSGRCRIGSHILEPDDILCIPPMEAADFEALEDVVLVAIKTPSLSADKVLGQPS